MKLTAQQLQELQNSYDLVLDLEDGRPSVSRKSGQLKPETVAKMLGIKQVPANWYCENGRVYGI